MTAFITIVIVLILIGALIFWSTISSYRRGQIDALNGIVKYEKQTNSDGETVWVERKK